MTLFRSFLNHKGKIAALLTAGLLWHFLSPVYGFYSHRGIVPTSPFGWSDLPEEMPETFDLYNTRYSNAAATVMEAMRQRRQEIGAPSYSATVAIGGEIVWTGTVGWASVENQVPATPETIYRIGSTSKPVTGTALARLVQSGVMDLDAPISTYMDDLPNPAWNSLTARQLASHMAGLAHYAQKGVKKDWDGLYATVALQTHYETMEEALMVFDGTSLRSKPGTEFYYSSPGTVLLGAAMSAAAGRPYLEVVGQEVTGPNGMVSTGPSIRKSNGSNNIATSYLPRAAKTGWQVRPWRPVDQSSRLPGGGFSSTSTDLARLGMSWLDDGYIDPDTRQAFWTPQRLANGEVNEQNYALGWRHQTMTVEGVGTFDVAHHGGVSRGAQAFLLVLPGPEMVISINANIKTDEFSDFGLLYRDIVQAFAATDG